MKKKQEQQELLDSLDAQFEDAQDALSRINYLIERQNNRTASLSQKNQNYQENIYPQQQKLQNIRQVARGIVEIAENHSQSDQQYNRNNKFDQTNSILSSYQQRNDQRQLLRSIDESQVNNKTFYHTTSNYPQQSTSHHLHPHKGIDQQETINRLMNAELRKKEKVLNLQLQRYMEEIAESSQGIHINEKSKCILKNKGYQPIHIRADQVLQQKQEKIHLLQLQRQEEIDQKEPLPSFQPNLDKRPTGGASRRSFGEFLGDMHDWLDRKNRNTEISHFQQVSQEMEESTFVPMINKKSKQIVKAIAKDDENNSWTSRLEKTRKAREERKQTLIEQDEQRYSFTPKINSKSQRLARQSALRNPQDIGLTPQKSGQKKEESKSPLKSPYFKMVEDFVQKTEDAQNINNNNKLGLKKSLSTNSLMRTDSQGSGSLLVNRNDKINQQEAEGQGNNLRYSRQLSQSGNLTDNSGSGNYQVQKTTNTRKISNDKSRSNSANRVNNNISNTIKEKNNLSQQQQYQNLKNSNSSNNNNNSEVSQKLIQSNRSSSSACLLRSSSSSQLNNKATKKPLISTDEPPVIQNNIPNVLRSSRSNKSRYGQNTTNSTSQRPIDLNNTQIPSKPIINTNTRYISPKNENTGQSPGHYWQDFRVDEIFNNKENIIQRLKDYQIVNDLMMPNGDSNNDDNGNNNNNNKSILLESGDVLKAASDIYSKQNKNNQQNQLRNSIKSSTSSNNSNNNALIFNGVGKSKPTQNTQKQENVNNVAYHPNLDFILGLLQKKK